MMVYKITQYFNQYTNILRLIVLIIFYYGHLKDCITPFSAPNNFLTPSLNYVGTKIRVKFSGSCLKQDKVTYTHRKIVNIYIVYEINKKDNTIISDPTLENCLFGAVTLTKHANIDKYGYSGYGIGFDRKEVFHFQVVDMTKM